ncbi:ATP-binding cassette sub-family A member 6 [Trichonephila clavata]|uniref:ATP-binding cassette sub-family A member 6 n=1 Tax=Trichonephila clavata TaxID=2740835 RepID=A0A8X6KDX3_TRICU|nr:ATP-binding cassette sub-family A member 6 [Trichonephila clavata]
MDPNLLFSQFKALILRNALIKKRNSYQLCLVVLLPIITMCFLIMQSSQPEFNIQAKGIIEYNLPFTYSGWSEGSKKKSIQLCVAPRSIKDKMVDSIQSSLSLHLRKFVKVLIFENENFLDAELAAKYADNSTECDIGMVFKGPGSYVLRISGDGCLSRKDCSIPSHGLFSSSQLAVDTTYFQEWLGLSNLTLPSTKVRGLVDAQEAAMLALLRYLKLLLIFIIQPVAYVVTENVIHEKTNKIKESMQLMGMKPVAYWAAWLFSEMILLIAILFPVSLTIIYTNLFAFKAICLHFLLWFGFGCTAVILAMTLTRFCGKASIANFILTLYLFLAYVSEAFIKIPLIPTNLGFTATDYLLMMISPFAYAKGFDRILKQHDYSGAIPAILLVFADFILYASIDFLLEYLFPYGFIEPWKKMKHSEALKKSNSKKEMKDECETRFIEKELCPPAAAAYIKIEKVKKAYSSFSKPITVLDELSLSVFKGEIMCLLGPNGAGKSTFLKIISRAMPPDCGKITTETTIKLGICPQENILYDELNAEEHLLLFGRLKGIPNSELKSKVEHLLSCFDLTASQSTMSKVLSGGQKRKLCVAIAMIGDPEVLLLDEPSSGMSPHSRKQLWSMLQEYTKSERSVLFTTHYMDEAELLSDRVALLYNGKLHCYGTVPSIKRHFGGGHVIKINLSSEASMYDKSEIVNILKKRLTTEAKVICTSDGEIIVKLPSFDAEHCIELFKEMRKHYEEMSPDCFTITVSALEEIFTQIVGKSEEEFSERQNTEFSEKNPDEDTEKKSDTPSLLNESESINHQYSYFRSFAILLRYRTILLIRSIYSVFPMVIPILLLSMHSFFMTFIEQRITQISPTSYRHEVIHVVNSSGKSLTLFEKALSELNLNFVLKEPGDILHEESYVKVDISSYEFMPGKFDVNWSWDISLRRLYALPILQNLISNILWVTWSGNSNRELKIAIQPIVKVDLNPPFHSTKTFLTISIIGFCIIFVSVIVGMEVIKEKERKIIWLVSKTKNNCKTYWLSTFIGHFLLCTISFIIMKIVLKIYDMDSDIYTPVWNAYFLAFPSCLLSTYLLGFVFKTYKSADIGMPIIILFVSTGLFVAFLVGQLKQISYINILNAVACFIFPIYTPFGLAVFLCDPTDPEIENGYAWNVFVFVLLPLTCALHMFLIINLEKWKGLIKGIKIKGIEESSWNEQYNPKSSVILKSVKKVYGKSRLPPFLKRKLNKEKTAIQNLDLEFNEGEVFAVMGSNGAGKSTLMKLLSENEALTSGEIIIRDKFRESISYCSEENIIWPDLSVKEHLQLFAVLNGIPIVTVNEVINR